MCSFSYIVSFADPLSRSADITIACEAANNVVGLFAHSA